MTVASGGLAAVASLGAAGAANAAQTFTVTNLNDSGPGSLRQAIADVNNDTSDNSSPGDSIVFASGVSGTIALTTTDDNYGDSLYITRPVQISGPGADQLRIQATPGNRAFGIFPGASGVYQMSAKISGVTISGGDATNHGGGSNQLGGGILAKYSALTLNHVSLSGNTASAGAAIADIPQSPYSYSPQAPPPLVMNDSTVAGNTDTGNGGGTVFSFYGDRISGSTVTGNSGGYATGVFNYAGTDQITGSTIAGNGVSEPQGGQVGQVRGDLSLRDSIVSGGAGDSVDANLYNGATGEASFSLIRNNGAQSGDPTVTTDGTDVTGLDPQLGPLGFNGGPTETMVPLPTSPVLDRGNSFGLSRDERGLPRPFVLPTAPFVPAGGDRSDIGAVETETPSVAAVYPISGGAGTSVGILGVGFTGATQVLFGSTPATSFIVENDGAIKAVAPVGSGTEDVRVITPLGESPAVGNDRFTFPVFSPSVSRAHPKRSGNSVNTGITVSCPAGGPSCSGTFAATRNVRGTNARVAHGQISLSAGQSTTIQIKLGSSAMHTLKTQGRLKLAFHIVVADGNGTPVDVTRTVTLTYKAKHKKVKVL